MKQKAIILIGLQGSGKSTFTKEYLNKHKDYKCVNRDSIRFMVDDYSFKSEDLVQKLWEASVKEILKAGFNLIDDEMNLNNKTKTKNIAYIKSVIPDIEIEEKRFEVDLKTAIERDKRRPFSVGEKVIRSTWNKYIIGKPERDCYNFKYKKDLPLVLLCDIDGTLALKHPDRDIYDGSKAYMDTVIEPIRRILEFINCDIILLSGRGEQDRKVTEYWLAENRICYEHLFMRAKGDWRPDEIVKEEIYRKEIEGKYNVLVAIDDRKSVLRLWENKLGLFTVNVSQDCDTLNEF